jgi:hypothetical protein
LVYAFRDIPLVGSCKGFYGAVYTPDSLDVFTVGDRMLLTPTRSNRSSSAIHLTKPNTVTNIPVELIPVLVYVVSCFLMWVFSRFKRDVENPLEYCNNTLSMIFLFIAAGSVLFSLFYYPILLIIWLLKQKQ